MCEGNEGLYLTCTTLRQRGIIYLGTEDANKMLDLDLVSVEAVEGAEVDLVHG